MIGKTVKEIKQKLDELGIEYPNNARKEELLELLNREVKEEQEKRYVVVYPRWKDLEDNDYIYTKGKPYPREGYTPTEERINELSTRKNKIGKVLIKEVD